MRIALSSLLVLAGMTAVPAAARVVCESAHVPVPITRNVYALEHQTRCWSEQDDALEQLHTRCELLKSAYGADDGQRRCRELVESSGLLR